MYENEGIRHIEIHHKGRTENNNDEEEEKSVTAYRKPPPHTQLLRADSDQVSLDSLFKAVLDIGDRLNEQEERLKVHECSVSNDTSSGGRKRRDRMCPKTAVHKYNKDDSASSESESELDQSHGSSTLSSKLSRRSARSSKFCSPPKSKSVDTRKNISFSNDSVRKIDMENQRLLKEILHTKSKTLTQRNDKAVRPQSASSINRLRKQKEIERENLRMLSRLQAVKPTESLSRDNLLTDHNRNEERAVRISKSARSSRPSSAVSTRTMDSREGSIDMFDNESVLSTTSTLRSTRSTSSKASRATSTKSSRSASAKKKKIKVCTLWESGW